MKSIGIDIKMKSIAGAFIAADIDRIYNLMEEENNV